MAAHAAKRARAKLTWIGLMALAGMPLSGPRAYAQDIDDMSEVQGEEAPNVADAAAVTPSRRSGVRALRVEVKAGGGVGTRQVERPTPYGLQRIGNVSFPAADIALVVSALPEEDVSFDVSVRYQTSLGLKLYDAPPFALSTPLPSRSERVELALAPRFRLGDSPRAMSLAVAVGGNARTLWPDIHGLGVVGYSLIGPFARPEIRLCLGDSLTLRIGVEAQWIALIDQALRAEGVGAMGFALGGELNLHVPLGRHLGLELSYRESHATAPGQLGSHAFIDIERFATGSLTGAL